MQALSQEIMMKTKAIVVTAPNTVELKEVEIPSPGTSEVLIDVSKTCVSPGTEMRCMSGNAEASTFPYVPGYCQVGVVMEGGPGTSIEPGTRVFSAGTTACSVQTQWGAHIAHSIRAEQDLIPIPDNVSDMAAAASKLAAISYHGVRLAGPVEGRKVAVLGLGPIGQFSARIHHVLGAEVVGGDVMANRMDLLNAFGVRAVNTREGMKEAFSALGDGAEIVVDATGVPALMPQIIELGREKPWDDSEVQGLFYVVQGSYAGEIPMPYQDAFMKETTFLFPRDHQRQDIEAVIKLISEGRLKTEDVVSRMFTPGEASEAYEALKNSEVISGTVGFDWS